MMMRCAIRSSRCCLGLLRSDEAKGFAYLGFQARSDFLVLLEERARILAALSNTFSFVAEPRAGFFHQIVLHANVEHVALARDTFSIEDVELGLAKRRRNFVLDHLYLGAGADDAVTVFERGDAADVYA